MNWQQIKRQILKPASSPEAARKKKVIIAMPLLVIVFIFVIARTFKQPASCNASVKNITAKVAGVVASANESSKVIWAVPQKYPENLRDPMQPKASVGDANFSGNIIVKGILYSDDKSSVVINNGVMHQGDKIGGTVIVKINKRNVEFEKDGKKWTQEVQQ